MKDILKIKDLSPFVLSVLKLDENFSSLDRLAEKIREMELKSETDLTQTRALMARFAECAESVSSGIVELATQLAEARQRAESAAQEVANKAEELQSQQNQHDVRIDAFRALTNKVNAINQELKEFKRAEGEILTADDRVKLSMRLAEFEVQLQPLIEEAQQIRKSAHEAKMKILEQNADSLSQSLLAVSKKLNDVRPTSH